MTLARCRPNFHRELVISPAIVAGDLRGRKHLARVVHNHYAILNMRSSRRIVRVIAIRSR